MDLEATKRETAEDLMEDPDGQYLAEVMGMTESEERAAEQRDLALIEGEILFYKRQAGGAIIEIGRRLIEAKRQLEHGEWLPWLREKVDLSERSAQNFMRLAKEYSKSAEIADLGASKALALLALPPQERERFASEKHDVDGVEKTASEMTASETSGRAPSCTATSAVSSGAALTPARTEAVLLPPPRVTVRSLEMPNVRASSV